jgi:putative oxidoreductase
MSPEFFLSRWSSELLSVLRITSALTFFSHGTQKLFSFPDPARANPELLSLSGIAGILEVVGGFLLIIGLFTRPVAFVLSGLMACAYWIAHAPRSFYPLLNGGEPAVLFCFIFLYIAAAGPGIWSVDAARRRAV